MAETLTLKNIMEACARRGALLIEAPAVNVDADTYTINKLAEVSPDPFRMRDSFLYKSQAATTAAYSPDAVTLAVDITAAQTSFVYTCTSDPIQAGHVIKIENEKMLVEIVTAATNTVQVQRGYDGTTAAAHDGDPAPLAVVQAAAPEFRRITTFGYPATNNVDIDRAFTFAESFLGQIYFMINPDDLKDCINESLQHPSIRTIERTTIAFVNNQNEYVLPNAVHTKTQILGVYLRDSTSTDIIEQHAPAWKPIEDDNAVTLHYITLPDFSSTVDMVVVWRKFFSPLASDAATTTCPRELIVPKATFEMYKKLFLKHGETAKRTFGQDAAIAEKEWMEYQMQVIAVAEARELQIGEPVYVPDVLPKSYSW